MAIAALIIAGNLVRDRSGESSEVSPRDLALSAVTSETPLGVAFRFGSLIDKARANESARIAEKQQRALERKQARQKQREKYADLPGSVSLATLNAIADCESGGDPDIVSSNGLYHGKYQFHPDTWESVGGKGLPSEAPEFEQDYRAALLYTRSGPGQWPICGQ